MNRIDWTQLGGFPLDQNDLEYHYGGIEDAIKEMAKGFGAGYILRGCGITDLGALHYTIDPGVVVMNDGEVCVFDGVVNSLLSFGIDAMVYVPSDSLALGQSEVFEDLTNVNVYKVRKAILGLAAGSPPVSAPIRTTLRDRVKELLSYDLGAWHVLDDAGEPALQNGYTMGSGIHRVMFRKEPNGIVRLKGRLNATGVAGTDDIAFQLPVGFRPGPHVTAMLSKSSLIQPVSSSARGAFVRASDNVNPGAFVVHLDGGATVNDIFELSGFPTFFAEA